MPEEEFQSPEFVGPRGEPIELPEYLAEEMMDAIDSDGADSGGADTEPLAGFGEDAKNTVNEFENWASSQSIEYGRLYDLSGAEIWRGSGGSDQISVPECDPDATFCHNHPKGTPPSFRDLFAGIRFQLRELRVVTPTGTLYSIRFDPTAYESVGNLRFRLSYLNDASWAVAEEWIRTKAQRIDENERLSRRFHAIYLQLASGGFLSYSRTDVRR